MRISVIIPALNESGSIAGAIAGITGSPGLEVILADGGSLDGTPDIAAGLGARVVRSAPGRAVQMNVAAAAASGEALLFLHADTRLPEGFEGQVRAALGVPGVVAGAFGFRLDAEFWGRKTIERLANFRSKRLMMPYGDQAIFVRTDVFRMAGGFPDQPIMEDFELVRRLGRLGRIAHLPAFAVTSARRWKRLGVLRTTLVNQAVIIGYLAGVGPDRLARWYRGGPSRGPGVVSG